MRRKTKMSADRKKKLIICLAMLFLPLVQYAIFYIGVNFNSIRLAFVKINADQTQTFVGFDNFKDVLHEMVTVKNWRILFRNSFLFFILDFIIKTPLVFLVAFFTYKHKGLGNFFKVMLFIPSILSVMVTVMIYEFFVDTALTSFVNTCFGTEIATFLYNPDTRFWAVFLYGFWCGFGSGLLLYVNAMEAIPKSIVEAAKIDGCTGFKEFIHITFPMVFPTFKDMFIVSVSSILTSQFSLYEFYGTKAAPDIQTVGYYLFNETTMTNQLGYPRLAAMGIIITGIAIPITLIMRSIMNKVDPMER